MHKEASKGDVPMKLTAELKSLIQWVADTILPSLTKLAGKDNTLKGLDISSIMSVGSPVSYSVAGGRNSSVVGGLGDASFISDRETPHVFEDKDTESTRAAAIAATCSVLGTFAEWISLRGVEDLFVSNHISSLSKLLESSDSATRKALLPWILHFVLTSLKNGDSSLLKDMLLGMKNVHPTLAEKEILSQFVLSLRVERILKPAISVIVHVARTIVVDTEEDASEDVDLSFLDKVGQCMRQVIECVLRENQSSLVLAQYLINEPKESSVRENLFKELASASPKGEVNGILRKWAAENSSKEDTAPGNEKENTDANQMCPENVTA